MSDADFTSMSSANAAKRAVRAKAQRLRRQDPAVRAREAAAKRRRREDPAVRSAEEAQRRRRRDPVVRADELAFRKARIAKNEGATKTFRRAVYNCTYAHVSFFSIYRTI